MNTKTKAILGIIIICTILSVSLITAHKITCSYDKTISMEKARFDFFMGTSEGKQAFQNRFNIPYTPMNKARIDLIYALNYARCS
jgi:hypothetical protein